MTRGWTAADAQTIRPGLERIRAAFDLSGHPERNVPAVQVAGTNGKGSTAAVLASILGRIGRPFSPVALYTSPHLLSPRERIRIGTRRIPDAEMARGMRKARRLAVRVKEETGSPLTYFETLTWIAVDWFSREGAGIAVMEAGLGGRWDATTACHRVASVVTTVGHDHREWLGRTLREIAAEKAAIIGSRTPAILGRLRPGARGVVRSRARRQSCPTWEFGRDFTWENDARGTIVLHLPGLSVGRVRLGLRGSFQRDNACVAAACALRLARDRGVSDSRVRRAVKRGIEEARWPGRFEFLTSGRNGPVVLDGGHNVDAAVALAGEIGSFRREQGFPATACVFSMLADKDARGFMKVLSKTIDACAVYPLDDPRAASPSTLAGTCRAAGVPCRTAPDFPAAFDAARLCAGKDGLVVVTGSLRTVADAYRHFRGRIR